MGRILDKWYYREVFLEEHQLAIGLLVNLPTRMSIEHGVS